MTTLILSFIVLLATVLTGVYIAYRLCNDTKFIVRLILLLPMCSAVFSLNLMLANDYIPSIFSLIREFSIFILYVLIAILLKGKRLLKNIDSICEREIA